jgi:hypothetical protein
MLLNSRLFSTVIVLALLGSGNALAQQKQTVKYTKTTRTTLSETKVYPGDIPNREMVQGIYSDVLTSPLPEWNKIEERVFNQDDQVAGTGTHRGASIDFFRDGDKLFQKYAGTHRTTVKDSGAWETNYEGTFDVTGGTGKYANVTGKGRYKGKITAEGFYEEGQFDIVY